MRELERGYTADIDRVNESDWHQVLGEFDDANIYQTWPYGVVISGRAHVSHFVLRRDGQAVAAAQVRLAKVPLLKVGIAYIRWGPIWARGTTQDVAAFRQALRGLRNEYACRRGLVLRLLPMLFDDAPAEIQAILEDEGFSSAGGDTRSQTILMDVRPPLETLRAGMKAHWKRELKVAERNNLEVVEGTNDALFEAVVETHREMVARKKFAEGNDINDFRKIQALLPDQLKMKVMVARSEGAIAYGLICSAIGKTGLYLFGATSTSGMKSRGSYLLHWTMLDRLKAAGVGVYDLNGINPVTNPGTYKFKNDLGGEHGRTVTFLGRYDASASALSRWSVGSADKLRTLYRRAKAGSVSQPNREADKNLAAGPEPKMVE